MRSWMAETFPLDGILAGVLAAVMTTPNPRSKLLPARGNYADLLAQVDDILDGEMCYAYDQDQYYQKEGGVLVAVGVPEAPADGSEYVRKDNAWAVATGGGGNGNVANGQQDTFAYYKVAGTSVYPTSSSMKWDEATNTLLVDKVECDSFSTVGTGSAKLVASSDLVFEIGGDVIAGGSLVTDIAEPVGPTDATTKAYVDNTFITTFEIQAPTDTEYAFQPGRGFPVETLNPDLVVYRGFDYHFHVPDYLTHPLLIKTAPGADNTNLFNEGVTGQGTETVILSVPMNPTVLTIYYQCESFAPMLGTIIIR